MRRILFQAIPFAKEQVTLALESGVDGLLVEAERVADVLALGRVAVHTAQEFETVTLAGKADEERAAAALRQGRPVLLAQGWEIIPVENLLAAADQGLAVEVASLDQARLAAGVLERGVPTLVVLPAAATAIKTIVADLKVSQPRLELAPAVITAIRPVGLGHRVCVDTMSLLATGQGMLVGNSSAFTFLVNAETEANPYVAARPFRINAGAVHAYALLPGDRTRYLEELRAGDEILVVGHDGATRLATVGRVKVEVRPMLQIMARCGDREGAVFLQNAETIRLVRPDGTPVSVVSLAEGDTILVRTDAAGRHFGLRIQEEITEA